MGDGLTDAIRKSNRGILTKQSQRSHLKWNSHTQKTIQTAMSRIMHYRSIIRDRRPKRASFPPPVPFRNTRI